MEYREYTDNNIATQDYYVPVSDGVELRVIDFIPSCDGPDRPLIVFIAGLISLISGWKDVLKEITPLYRTLYIETREKKSSRVPDITVDFSIDRMTQDLEEVLTQLVPVERPFCFIGSSLGSTVILDYLSRNSRQSFDAFVIAPNCEFRFPFWFLITLRILPSFFYPAIKYILKWYLRTFRLDKKREPEQVRKYEGTIDAAEPKRLKASALAIKDYSLWHKLPSIMEPVLVIGAKSDILHGIPEMEQMIELMPSARLEIMESNKETHSAEAGIFIVSQIKRHYG
jgi:pimeloyl-ACP methyl ester carboxylesterase